MKASILIFSFVMTGIMAVSQSMVSYTWDTYKMKFEIPENFVEKANSSEKFEASNDDINLTIYPRKGENLTAEGMIDALAGWVSVSKIENLTEMDLISDQLNGYWGIFQEGTKNGWPVFLMLIVDPDFPDISFYVWVSYRAGTEDTAVKMLTSFKPI
jgi:hypothetical protein